MDGIDADDLLFSPDALSPEVFGVFRADPTFEVYGCSSSPITIVQTINRGNLDTSKEPSSVFLWTSAVALSKLWQEVGDGLPSALGRRVLLECTYDSRRGRWLPCNPAPIGSQVSRSSALVAFSTPSTYAPKQAKRRTNPSLSRPGGPGRVH